MFECSFCMLLKIFIKKASKVQNAENQPNLRNKNLDYLSGNLVTSHIYHVMNCTL